MATSPRPRRQAGVWTTKKMSFRLMVEQGIMLLLFNLHRSKSFTGVWCRMQWMYAMAFTCRYRIPYITASSTLRRCRHLSQEKVIGGDTA